MDDKKKIAERIAALVDARFPGYGGRKDAATALGYSESQLSTILKGKRDLEMSTYRRIADGLGVSVAELTGDPIATFTLPFRGWVSAGKGIEEPSEPGEVLNVPEIYKSADSVYRARGRSMVDAMIAPGDWLVVRTNPGPDTGEIVVAWLHDDGMVVKKFGEDAANGKHLRSMDGKDKARRPLTEKDEVIGVLVGVVRKV